MFNTSPDGNCRRALPITLMVLACLATAGCRGGGGDTLKLHPATGKALCRGVPMKYALVTLYPLDGEAKTRNLLPHANVGEDGSYTLGTYRMGDGAPAGRYQVTVTWPNQPESQMGMPSYVMDQFEGRYANAKTSKIEFTIKEGDNTLPPIELQ